MKELWVEKYRPSTLKDYVVRDEAQRNQIAAWIKEGATPHLLFSGAPGVGKTTLTQILFNERTSINPFSSCNNQHNTVITVCWKHTNLHTHCPHPKATRTLYKDNNNVAH